MNIKGLYLTEEKIKKIKNNFEWNSFCVGNAKIHEMPNGSIFSGAPPRITKSICFEIGMRIENKLIYVMIALNEYKNGCIIHLYSKANISKANISKIIEKIVNAV
ncbi:MAG: hypothetical protein WC942_09760 [Clostridia bacterium]|jgi:hypothetical protein